MSERQKFEFVDEAQQEGQTGNVPESVVEGVMESGNESRDPFEELMTEDRTSERLTVEPETEVQQETTQLPVNEEDLPLKEDPSSYRFWQSRYDMQTRELDQMKGRMVELEQVAPIANYLKQNPQALTTLEQSLSNGQIPSTGESLKKPDRPSKPANYDPIDAYSDPDSKSYKYRDTLEEYRDNMLTYQQEQQEVHMAAIDKEASVRKQIAAEQTQVMQMQNLRGDLMQNRGFSDEDAQSFIDTFKKPESVSIDNLVKLWKLENSPSEQNQIKAKSESMQREKSRLAISTPVGVTPGHDSQAGKTIEDRLMDDMIGDFNKKNPWS